MGTWGPGIFSDDFALDLQEEFTDLISQGISASEATTRLVKDFGLKTDPYSDYGPVFWLALAATQWKLGRLEESVKERALHVIESGIDVQRWEEEVGPDEARQRAMVLGKLKKQLLSPPPAAKAVRKRYVQETEFEAGDVWKYRLLSGQEILFLVVGHQQDPGGRYPIVEILKASGRQTRWPVFLLRFQGTRRPLTGGPRRVAIARWSKNDYPADRLERVPASRLVSDIPDLLRSYREAGCQFQWWKHLDNWLEHHFGLK